MGLVLRNVLLICLVSTAVVGVGAGPVTQPGLHTGSAGAALPMSAIRGLIEKLGDKDGDVRAAARRAMLGLTDADLPAIKQVIREMAPLPPTLAASMKEVVVHVYLAGQKYDASEAGFLGLSLRTRDLRDTKVSLTLKDITPLEPAADTQGQPGAQAVAPQVPPQRNVQVPPLDPQGAEDHGPIIGIVVTDAMPGLAAYRYLDESDVIVSVGDVTEFHEMEDFRSAVSKAKPGQPIPMRIIRRGKLMTVEVVPSARPLKLEVQANASEEFRQEMSQMANTFWETEFAALVDGEAPVSPAALHPLAIPVGPNKGGR